MRSLISPKSKWFFFTLFVTISCLEFLRKQVVFLYNSTNATIVNSFPKLEHFDFHSNSKANSNSVRLFLLGDTGRASFAQRQVSELMEAECRKNPPNAVVFLGDNFYDHGVSSVNDAMWQTHFENIYAGECLLKTRMYAALGNHDFQGNIEAQIEYTQGKKVNPNSSERWTMPSRFYEVSFGNLVSLFVIDTDTADWCGQTLGCSLDKTRTAIEESFSSWKIVAGHHPFLSGGKYKKTSYWRRFVFPKVLCAGAQVYFSGHDHNMQLLNSSVDSLTDFADAVCHPDLVVSGGGGADLVPVSKVDAATLFAKSAHGFVSGTWTSQDMRLDFFEVGQANPVFQLNRNLNYFKSGKP